MLSLSIFDIHNAFIMEVNLGFTQITNDSVLSVDSHAMDNKDLIKNGDKYPQL